MVRPRLSLAFFCAASTAGAIPRAIQLFVFLATLLLGRVILSMPMLFAAGALAAALTAGSWAALRLGRRALLHDADGFFRSLAALSAGLAIGAAPWRCCGSSTPGSCGAGTPTTPSSGC